MLSSPWQPVVAAGSFISCSDFYPLPRKRDRRSQDSDKVWKNLEYVFSIFLFSHVLIFFLCIFASHLLSFLFLFCPPFLLPFFLLCLHLLSNFPSCLVSFILSFCIFWLCFCFFPSFLSLVRPKFLFFPLSSTESLNIWYPIFWPQLVQMSRLKKY